MRTLSEKIKHNILLPFGQKAAGEHTGYVHDRTGFSRATILFYCFGIVGSPTSASVQLDIITQDDSGQNTYTTKTVTYSTTDGTLNMSGTTQREFDVLFGVNDYENVTIKATVSFTGGTSPTMNIGAVVVLHGSVYEPAD